MAANKFATMLHRNTHRITVILVYALLEWILIILLLLNSFFSFLITKFATYFGLKPPCLWCSRLDRVLDKGNLATNSYRDLVCEAHATEISRLSFCSTHGRLAESHTMCLDCLAASPRPADSINGMATTRIAAAFISWVTKDHPSQDNNGDDDDQKKSSILRCSCCDGSLSSDLYPPPPYLLFKPSSGWGALKCTLKGSNLMLMEEEEEEEEVGKLPAHDDMIETNNDSEELHDIDDNEGDHGDAHPRINVSEGDCFSLKDATEDEISKEANHEDSEAEKDSCRDIELVHHQPSSDDRFIEYCLAEDDSLEIICLLHHKRNNSDCEFDRLVPVEVIDSSTSACQDGSFNFQDLGCERKQEDHKNEALWDDEEEQEEESHVEEEQEEKEEEEVENMEMSNKDHGSERSSVSNLAEASTDLDDEASKQVAELQETQAQALLIDENNGDEEVEMKELDDPPGKEQVSTHLSSSGCPFHEHCLTILARLL